MDFIGNYCNDKQIQKEIVHSVGSPWIAIPHGKCRIGIARLKRAAHKPGLPSISLTNSNKTEDFIQKDRNWWQYLRPGSTQGSRVRIHQADRKVAPVRSELTGCAFTLVIDTVCINTTLRDAATFTTLTLRCWPFNLLEEFAVVVITVYISSTGHHALSHQ